MVRRRDTRTRVLVDVDDLTAAGLGPEWVDPDTEHDGDQDGAPRGNASRDEWAAYADQLDVQYEPDAKRDDIKAAVAAKQAADAADS